MCGGTRFERNGPFAIHGLSPRVRGNRRPLASPPIWRRSIPACAGEPGYRAVRRTPAGVYPRVCGGTPRWGGQCGPGPGLSPRVRGNPLADMVHRPFPGSIPACAGEPPNAALLRIHTRVYPRVCGGTVEMGDRYETDKGLSPRVRGNRVIVLPSALGERSIPACAGEPWPTATAPARKSVYPRVCGGTSAVVQGVPGRDGLSPRVRGNLPEQPPLMGLQRSIPACAGEPDQRDGHMGNGRVYPRVCGGTMSSSTEWPSM